MVTESCRTHIWDNASHNWKTPSASFLLYPPPLSHSSTPQKNSQSSLRRGLLLRVYVWVFHALLSATSVIPWECPCDWLFVITPLGHESDKCIACGPHCLPLYPTFGSSYTSPNSSSLLPSYHSCLPSCVYPAILLFASFAEQLEDITSNFGALLLQAHWVKLSPVAVFAGLWNTSRTICC